MKVVKKGATKVTLEMLDENGVTYLKVGLAVKQEEGMALITYAKLLRQAMRACYKRVIGEDLFMKEELTQETYKGWWASLRKGGRTPQEPGVNTEDRNY